jgi:hypothetical protein
MDFLQFAISRTWIFRCGGHVQSIGVPHLNITSSITVVLMKKACIQINPLSIHFLSRAKWCVRNVPQRSLQQKICLQLKWPWSVRLELAEAINQMNSCLYCCNGFVESFAERKCENKQVIKHKLLHPNKYSWVNIQRIHANFTSSHFSWIIFICDVWWCLDRSGMLGCHARGQENTFLL